VKAFLLFEHYALSFRALPPNGGKIYFKPY